VEKISGQHQNLNFIPPLESRHFSISSE